MSHCHEPVITVVLAAGQSRRFGGNKQLADIDGMPMVRRTVHAASGDGPLVLVAGHEAAAVMNAARAPFSIVNDNYRDGLGSSIALAARSLSNSAAALLFCLADQPFVPGAHFRKLRAAWDGDPKRILASTYDGKRGVPALFGASWFDALAGLEGDRGAQNLIGRHARHVRLFPLTGSRDIDTPDDLDDFDD